jgi:hypothetical protein
MAVYRIQEGQFDLAGTWQDRSVTMLVPDGLPDGVSLVVTRDALPPALDLDGHLARQLMTMRREMPGLTLLADSATTVDGRPARLMEVRWVNGDQPLYQMVVVVLDEQRLLNFTASAPGAASDTSVRETLWRTIAGFTFGRAAMAS